VPIEDSKIKPPFGHHLGIWYPLVWRILALHKFWSPSLWLPKNSALAIDIYIGIWWFLEILCVFLCGLGFKWQGTISWFFVFLVLFRFGDIMFVLSSILVKGYYKDHGDWPSVNRITLLVVFNALEIMLIFAILFRALGILMPEIASASPVITNFFDSLYFSVVTGISLGYGVPHPIGWLSRLLSMLEASAIFIVIIAVIGYITSEKKRSYEHRK
jgi:hypothetical protein